VKAPSKKILLVGAAAAVGAAALVFALRAGREDTRYATAVVDRGDIAEVVGATGTLQAVTTVQVGSQVSGIVQELLADFNSRVSRGQVVARLDPSTFQARLGQAQANLVSARANVERQQAAVEDARLKLARAEELAREQLLPESDLETARTNFRAATAQLKANQAAVTQAAAGVNQAQVDLAHTVIKAPIDGIVVGRSVDVGQTVAASLQAPTLFVIAQDLSRMQVLASIDEADIGRVKTGQTATFRVDSFPEQTFEGRVEQVRLQPTTLQNVVTYGAIIAVDNPGQRLMPGMTATVSLIVDRRDDVLRIPAAAVRFRPSEGAAVAEREGRGRDPAATVQAGEPSAGAPGERRRDAAAGPRTASPDGGGVRGQQPPSGDGATTAGAPGVPAAKPAVVYLAGDGALQSRRVRIGMSDGQFVELVAGLEEGARVVTGVESAAAAAARPSGSPTGNPFAPGRPQRRQR
jgi:HlyD family secretion protein